MGKRSPSQPKAPARTASPPPVNPSTTNNKHFLAREFKMGLRIPRTKGRRSPNCLGVLASAAISIQETKRVPLVPCANLDLEYFRQTVNPAFNKIGRGGEDRVIQAIGFILLSQLSSLCRFRSVRIS